MQISNLLFKLITDLSCKFNGYLENAALLPYKIKATIVVCAAIVATLLCCTFIVSPWRSDLQIILAQQIKTQATIKNHQQQLQQLHAAIKQFKKLEISETPSKHGKHANNKSRHGEPIHNKSVSDKSAYKLAGTEEITKVTGERKINEEKIEAEKIVTTSKLNLALLLQDIADAARLSQLTILALKPNLENNSFDKEEEERATKTEKTKPATKLNAATKTIQTFIAPSAENINLVACGSYQQIITFFATLQHLQILITVPLFTLQPTDNISNLSNDQNIHNNNSINNLSNDYADNKLLLNTTIQIYPLTHKKYFTASPIPVVTSASATATSKNATAAATLTPLHAVATIALRNMHDIHDPFTPISNTALSSLALWESKDLRFLGELQHDGQTLGAVSDPSGNIHYVTVGEAIGVNNKKILRITHSGIITEGGDENIYR